ncbi:hypothetical protein WKI68_22810 [Streptomyces sp. MS1.HAVA.3]|uniref:Uncharacterized protein n=1 Tax=Streptomyces caledonius TaxID=3134107 RepID=A0ABU8U835_9ACTN
MVRPAPGAKVSGGDGIEVELMTTAGPTCDDSAGRANFGYDAYPISATGVRWGVEDANCAAAGVYYAKVTRTSAKGYDQSPWPLEIKVQREPGRGAGVPTTAPGTWPSGPPSLPGTEAVPRPGEPASTTPAPWAPGCGATRCGPARPASTGSRWTGGSSSGSAPNCPPRR